MSPTFGEYSLRLIGELREQGRFGTSQTYEHARRSFVSFLAEERCGSNITDAAGNSRITDAVCNHSASNSRDVADMSLDRMDKAVIERYNLHLRKHGVLRNTISFYNRALRAIYNKGVKEFCFEDRHPFSGVYTGVDRTRNRAVSESILALVALLDTCDDAALTLARDMFMFSYAMRGMPFVDMAYLRKSQIKDDVLTYTRRKTGGTIRVRIECDVYKIIERYSGLTEGSEYLFPILCDAAYGLPEGQLRKSRMGCRSCVAGTGYNPEAGHSPESGSSPAVLYTRYRSGLTSYNRNLKRLAAMAGIGENLSSYVARHSWATAARGIGSDVPVISEALGHSSERMTRIYMGSLDSVLVDNTNRRLLDRLKECCLEHGASAGSTPSAKVRDRATPATKRKASSRNCGLPAERRNVSSRDCAMPDATSPRPSTRDCAMPAGRPESTIRECLPAAIGSVPPASVGPGNPAYVNSDTQAAIGSVSPACVESGNPTYVNADPQVAIGSVPPARQKSSHQYNAMPTAKSATMSTAMPTPMPEGCYNQAMTCSGTASVRETGRFAHQPVSSSDSVREMPDSAHGIRVERSGNKHNHDLANVTAIIIRGMKGLPFKRKTRRKSRAIVLSISTKERYEHAKI